MYIPIVSEYNDIMTTTTKCQVHTYKTSGQLTEPVTDLTAAREYLAKPNMVDYIKYCDESLVPVVHDITWDLTDESSWVVRVITTRELTQAESAKLSDWISGQNSDGLGEGFEQQAFAEHGNDNEYSDDYDDDWSMSSFDWQTNDCKLELVR